MRSAVVRFYRGAITTKPVAPIFDGVQRLGGLSDAQYKMPVPRGRPSPRAGYTSSRWFWALISRYWSDHTEGVTLPTSVPFEALVLD